MPAARMSAIVEAVLGRRNDRADGDGEHDVVGVGAVLAGATTVASAPGGEPRLAPERREIAQIGFRDDHDVAATAAVASVRPTLRHVLLAAEREATVAASPGRHRDRRAVIEHGVSLPANRRAPASARVRDETSSLR